MQEKPVITGQDENGVRMLNPRPILAHNRHIKAGVAARNGCLLCKEGVGAMVTSVESPKPEPKLDEDSGADEGGDSPHARADGWPFQG